MLLREDMKTSGFVTLALLGLKTEVGVYAKEIYSFY